MTYQLAKFPQYLLSLLLIDDEAGHTSPDMFEAMGPVGGFRPVERALSPGTDAFLTAKGRAATPFPRGDGGASTGPTTRDTAALLLPELPAIGEGPDTPAAKLQRPNPEGLFTQPDQASAVSYKRSLTEGEGRDGLPPLHSGEALMPSPTPECLCMGDISPMYTWLAGGYPLVRRGSIAICLSISLYLFFSYRI